MVGADVETFVFDSFLNENTVNGSVAHHPIKVNEADEKAKPVSVLMYTL